MKLSKCPRKFLPVQLKIAQVMNFLFCPTILLLCTFRSYLLCSKPIKPGHYNASRVHALCILLIKYGEMAQ